MVKYSFFKVSVQEKQIEVETILCTSSIYLGITC